MQLLARPGIVRFGAVGEAIALQGVIVFVLIVYAQGGPLVVFVPVSIRHGLPEEQQK